MINVESLLQNVGDLTPASVALVALAGLIIGVAPSSFPLLAVAGGLGARDGTAATGVSRLRGFCLAAGFGLGIATVDAVLGALFGYAGFAVLRVLNSAMAWVYGLLTVILVLTALMLWRVIHLKLPVLRPSARTAQSFGGAFALGLPFGLSTCPACTPLLLPVVVAATSSADPIKGAVLMGSFGLARSIPLVAAGVAASSLAHWPGAGPVMRWTERIGGGLLLAAAAWFAWQTAIYAGWAG
ncbi:sulfite exporter TauE/SafE family protein (plasmid) [Leisingera aquaemixtae]|uniref:Sulfite exporter TauE/SafE family protein n=1 Tax=Leisingera aquaemixtae TaxID=1396826 RepID=A0ABY5WRJ8_9RHOB|nr:cytochrome c biogenesis protein CcdA [Leisingera aquaemixtae]UWQ44045.1 sulfite exporter TauE/SafE family protein [Leisingera aquaemixtae]